MQGSEKYKIDIRPEAWAEISRIADKHLSLVGPASAKKITDQLLDDINMLATSPYMGMECPEYLLIPDHYRRLVSGVYKDVIFDTGPVAGKVYKNSENRRKQGVSCGFRCSCRYSISLTSSHPERGCSRCRSS